MTFVYFLNIFLLFQYVPNNQLVFPISNTLRPFPTNVMMTFTKVHNKMNIRLILRCFTWIWHLRCQKRPGKHQWCWAAHKRDPNSKETSLVNVDNVRVLSHRTCVCAFSPHLKFHHINKCKVIQRQVFQNLGLLLLQLGQLLL